MRRWAVRMKAAIERGDLACPGDGSACARQAQLTGRHLHNCLLAPAQREIDRIERLLGVEL